MPAGHWYVFCPCFEWETLRVYSLMFLQSGLGSAGWLFSHLLWDPSWGFCHLLVQVGVVGQMAVDVSILWEYFGSPQHGFTTSSRKDWFFFCYGELRPVFPDTKRAHFKASWELGGRTHIASLHHILLCKANLRLKHEELESYFWCKALQDTVAMLSHWPLTCWADPK